MHAGTPTAVSAHVFLCVALACVMSARAFTDALRPPSAAMPLARALVTAPGTSAHVWRVFLPQQTAFALAARVPRTS